MLVLAVTIAGGLGLLMGAAVPASCSTSSTPPTSFIYVCRPWLSCARAPWEGLTMFRTKLLSALTVAIVGIGLIAAPALAVNVKPTSSTTLDACGYFMGTTSQNKVSSTTSGTATTTSDKGTWTGVTNTYGGTPVASLGPVKGSYTQTYTFDTATNNITNGTETFRSNRGSITQSFERIGGTWSVEVVATGELSFLTSDTDGACYTGEYPRP